jgi:mono/diheme cytochrome c family protein
MKKIYFLATFFVAALSVLSCKKENDSAPVVDCTTSGLSVSGTPTNASCGATNGALALNGTGGKAPYQYSIDGTTFQTSKDFSNLAAKDYTLTIKDANNCISAATVKVDSNAGITVASTTAIAAGCGETDGGLQISASGGQGALQYSIDGTNFSTTAEFSNLAAGSYNLTVKDAAGCTTDVAGVKVGVKPSSISYETTIKSIVTTNCAISGCHVTGGTGPGNFADLATLKSKASQIKTRTGNKSMPIGRTLTDEQIQQIACWVDAGAPSE